MTNNEIGIINDKMKELNEETIKGLEKNLASDYYSSMDVHRRILQEHQAIKIIIEM